MSESSVQIQSLKNRVSPEEWQLRVDLAAAYRLVAAFKWDDLVFTHISARLPGPEHHFLINPRANGIKALRMREKGAVTMGPRTLA